MSKAWKAVESCTFAGGVVRVEVHDHPKGAGLFRLRRYLTVHFHGREHFRTSVTWPGDEAHAMGLGVVRGGTPVGILADWCEGATRISAPGSNALVCRISDSIVIMALRSLDPVAVPDRPSTPTPGVDTERSSARSRRPR